ncbi:reverse transcriptase domain-containing protein [Tanacetum coccineum]
MEKLILALVHVARRLRRYFQAHMITVLTNSPIKQTLTKPEKSGRVAQWAIKLGEHGIVFQERGDETPKDLLMEVPLEDNKKEAEEKADTKPTKTELSCEWKLFTDGAASSDGSGAGLMLIDPEGKEYTYALRFEFETTNNEAEFTVIGESNKSYTIEHIRRNQNKKADELSKLASMTFKHLTKEVLVKVLPKWSIEEKETIQVETKEGESWMTPIYEYLVSGLLPDDLKESRKIRVKAPQYKLIRGNMYRRSFYTHGSNHDQWWLELRSKGITGCQCTEMLQRFGVPQTISSKDDKHFREGIFADLYKGLKVTQSFSPITEHMEIMNHIEKQLARSQQGWVDDLAQTIIPISENDVAKDDRGRIKEVDKRRGSKEIASIEEAYYRRKLRKHHNKRSRGDIGLETETEDGVAL